MVCLDWKVPFNSPLIFCREIVGPQVTFFRSLCVSFKVACEFGVVDEDIGRELKWALDDWHTPIITLLLSKETIMSPFFISLMK